MIKFIGSVMILCSGIGAGVLMSYKNKSHLKSVEAIEKMFVQTSLMLKYSVVTFDELIGFLQKSSQTNGLNFLKADINSLSLPDKILVNIRENEDNLSNDEINSLYDFFSQFGQTDLDGQISLSKRYEHYFQDKLVKMREESRVKCKLYNSLGVLGGAFVAVMLI